MTSSPRIVAFALALLAATASASAQAPEQPGRADVMRAMQAVAPQVRACSHARGGTVTASFEFTPDGHVKDVTIRGQYADGAPVEGSPEQGCILGALRAAVVPAFTAPAFRVNFPFRL